MTTSTVENEFAATGPDGERFTILCKSVAAKVEGLGVIPAIQPQTFRTSEGYAVEQTGECFLIRRGTETISAQAAKEGFIPTFFHPIKSAT